MTILDFGVLTCTMMILDLKTQISKRGCTRPKKLALDSALNKSRELTQLHENNLAATKLQPLDSSSCVLAWGKGDSKKLSLGTQSPSALFLKKKKKSLKSVIFLILEIRKQAQRGEAI